MEIRHLSQEMELLRKEHAEANEVLCLLRPPATSFERCFSLV
jgi:hypothetical protein